MAPVSRRRFLAAAGLASLAGCSELLGSTSDGAAPSPSPAGAETEGETVSPGLTVPTRDERLPLPMSPNDLRDASQSGGPSKDGIPSIDDPRFVVPGAVDFLDAGDPVFGVARDGVAKAYPQKILVAHEIVNDELAGIPVSVTYCPLTGTVQGFERGETTFGVSGRLINNNLVMYDRATETWWPQILATSIPGPWNEDPPIRSLREFRLIWTTWGRWRDAHPETAVLSTDTGYAGNYARDPYGSYNPAGGYYRNANLLFPVTNDDDRYDHKTVFMGARTPDGAVAVRKRTLREEKLATGTLGDTPVIAVYDPRYDTGYVYLNPDDRPYEYDDGSVVSAEGIEHQPDALPLKRVHTFDAMWFAWAAYYPETTVYA
ncbi:DUF3179 domain-containing protein [Halobacteria archaeon HArc-gm2]|nr:DUF3179 domain-containing protein [Halobacteria archaeon HArc-gm2]